MQRTPHYRTTRSAILPPQEPSNTRVWSLLILLYALYLFFTEFILQVEDSYDNIVSYRPLGASYQGPIDYIEPRSISSTAMDTPSDRPSMITPQPKPQSPHIIPSYEDSTSFQASLPPSIDIEFLPQPLNKVLPTEPSNVTLHKNSIEPLSISTLNLVHRDDTNLTPIPPSSIPSPCDNQTQSEYLNIHHILGCRQFRNKKHLAAATNASLVKSGNLPSTIGYFATIANPPKGNPIKKRHMYLDKVHMDVVFGDCVAS